MRLFAVSMEYQRAYRARAKGGLVLLRLLRAGYWRDLLTLILVTTLLGSMVAGGVALVADKYFAGTVSGLVGEYGEYDVIVHVREDAAAAVRQEIRDLVEEQLDGAHVKQGITVAGKANYFVAIPERHKTQAQFERLNDLFTALSGYAGLTFITEPSVVVNNVHNAVRQTLLGELQSIDGVRFVFRDGANLVAVLEDPERAETVYQAAKQLSEQYRILEARFPFQYELDDPEQAARTVEQAMQQVWGEHAVRDVTVAGSDGEMGSFVTALQEMKRFLTGYASRAEITLNTSGSVIVNDLVTLTAIPGTGDAARPASVAVRITGVNAQKAVGYVERGEVDALLDTQVTVRDATGRTVGRGSVTNERLELVRAIDAGLELLDQLSVLSVEAGDAVGSAEETLKTFQAALVQLETVQEQVRQINEELTARSSADPGQVLLSVLLSGLVKRMTPEQDVEDLKEIDIPGMQAGLRDMASRLDAMSRIDMAVVKQEMLQVRDNLPRLTDTQIGDSLRLIERYLAGQVVPGDQIQLLLNPEVDQDQSQKLMKSVLGRSDISVFVSPAAVVTPNARATLFSVLGEVRRTIAGLTALALTLLALLLDHAVLFSSLQLQQREKGADNRLLRRLRPGNCLWAMAMGSILLIGVYTGSGARIPGLAQYHVLLLGGGLGWLIYALARRISPVDAEEWVAGVALGLNPAQVMREIVVPANRPGLLLFLNRARQVFH